MQKRQLGKNGPMVSAVGIGAMSFSDVYGATNRDESFAVLRRALELGIDHIDTANIYGQGLSEEVIGAFLKEHGGPNPFTIATKASITRHPETGERMISNEADHLASELDKSLKRLGLDRVDLYYIHRRDPKRPIEDVVETLEGFVKAGKIGSYGFSEIAPSSLLRANAVGHVAAVQSEYSLSTRAPELGLVQECEKAGTALVAFSPVGRGLLTDTPPDKARAAASWFLSSNPRFTEENLPANLRYVDAFRAVAADLGTSAAALSIAWVLRQSGGVIAIPGTRSVAHLEELAAGAELSLSDADVERIEEALPLGWAHGDRYSVSQWIGPERFC